MRSPKQIWHVLPGIDVPTLLLYGDNDMRTPLNVAGNDRRDQGRAGRLGRRSTGSMGLDNGTLHPSMDGVRW